MSPSAGTQNRWLRKRTVLEWSVLVIALIAIVSVAAGLVIYSLSSETGPPDLRVDMRPTSGQDGSYVVRVTNRGGTTAEDVVIEVTLGVETRQVEFMAVAKGDREEAIVVLEGTGEPRARVKTFKEP